MGFNPLLANPRPCWECAHFDGMTAGATAVLCGMPGGARVQATPERGCAFWEREAGADDETLSLQEMRATWGWLKWPEPSIRGIRPPVPRGRA
jgi:hypothetical protein